ncbi:MAG: RNA pseudouridine synthase [Methylococcales bacterium]|nr:RNA pseudouridine synthase [Methylococcales bacterium]
MSPQDKYFSPFKAVIDTYSLSEQFTFPFYYQPHPLCLLAAKELQAHLIIQKDWQHNFGLKGEKESAIGKMFGVLLVKNKHNEIGYLSAFSGKMAGTNKLPEFVPPVFDMLAEDGFFMTGQCEINLINEQIKELENNPQILVFKTALKAEIDASSLEIKKHRTKMIEGRKQRKVQRIEAEIKLNTRDFLLLKQQLSKQSIRQKNQLRDLTVFWDERVKKAETNLNQLTDEITRLKNQRKELSAVLQQKLFDQYRFLNVKGEQKNLSDIFKQTTQLVPPAGAGDCAAPKLLHYAFKTGMKPLAMAEFWWGASPKSEIKKHLNFYGACQGKCQPILEHMLEGLKMDDNPLLNNPAEGKSIDIIYEDEVMLVINKPSGLLSVPGKSIEDSVYMRIKQSYPKATGSLIIHRLDMSTSGLMLMALNKDANKKLQRQFIHRSIKKRYVALLDGLIKEDEGTIDLPLRVDLDDRPRQLVCYQFGKPAKTQWQVIERKNKQTKVYFYPITGRTHQLRVHSAHLEGLNTAIIGDDLYGDKASRLHLHAEYIEFNHPVTRELMIFQVDAEF